MKFRWETSKRHVCCLFPAVWAKKGERFFITDVWQPVFKNYEEQAMRIQSIDSEISTKIECRKL